MRSPVAFLLLACAIAVGAPDDGRKRAYTLKAAFVRNFCKYTRWPAGSFKDQPQRKAPLRIGVAGPADVRRIFGVLNGKKVGGRTLKIVPIARAADAASCQVLFVAQTDKRRLAALLPSLARRPVLTVGEQDGFALRHGCVNLYEKRVGKKTVLRFSVHRERARRTGLRLDARLIGLADRVLPPPDRNASKEEAR